MSSERSGHGARGVEVGGSFRYFGMWGESQQQHRIREKKKILTQKRTPTAQKGKASAVGEKWHYTRDQWNSSKEDMRLQRGRYGNAKKRRPRSGVPITIRSQRHKGGGGGGQKGSLPSNTKARKFKGGKQIRTKKKVERLY